MNIVYLDSFAELTSVKKFLELSQIDNYLIVRSLADVLVPITQFQNNSDVNRKLDLYVFDFKQSTDLVDYLSHESEEWCTSLTVYTTDIMIGRRYRELTDSVHIMPPVFNLMLLLWNHPAFSIDNLVDVESVNDAIKLNVSTVDSDSASIKISTEIKNNLVSLNINKVNDIELSDLSLQSDRKPSSKRRGVARTSYKEVVIADLPEVEDDITDTTTEEAPTASGSGLFSLHKSTPVKPKGPKGARATAVKSNMTDTVNSGFKLANLKINRQNQVLTIYDYLTLRLGIPDDTARDYERRYKSSRGYADLAEYCLRNNILLESDYLNIMSELYGFKTLSSEELKSRVATFEAWSHDIMADKKFVQLLPQEGEDDIVVVISMYDPMSASQIVRLKRNSATVYYTLSENLSKLLGEG